MNVPRFVPKSPTEASLSLETFEAVYTSVGELVGEGVIRVRDLEDKMLGGRPTEVVGQQWRLVSEPGAVNSDRLRVIMLNERGISLAGEVLAEDNATDPGYPIAYIDFEKIEEHVSLDGWLQLLDTGVISVTADWNLSAEHLPENPLYIRNDYVRFAGMIGLRRYLFGPRGVLGATHHVSDHHSFLREGEGRSVNNAMKKLSKRKT